MDYIKNMYLKLRKNFNNIKNEIFDVSEVKIFKNNKIKDYTFRFYIIRAGYKLLNLIDVDGDKVHIEKKNNTGNKTIIINTYENSLKKTIEEINYRSKIKKKIDPKIITLFKIDNKCIKKLSQMYKEDDEINDHSLENILLFNSIKYDKNSYIKIQYFENGKLITLEKKVIDIIDLHINNVINQDNID